MKILIFGAGSIGSVIGGFLKKAGCDVFFVGRKAHVERVREKGLLITGIWGEHRITGIEAFTSVNEVKETSFDAVIISVKSFDTVTAIEALKGTASPLFVSFQNGLGNVEKLEMAFGKEKAGGARVIFGAEMIRPGEVKVTVEADAVAVGPLWGPWNKEQKSGLQALVDALTSGGIRAFYTDSVIVHLWAKVLYNAPLNPLSAMFKVPYGKLLQMEHTRRLMRDVIKEAFSVAKGELRDALPWKTPEEYIRLFEEKLVPSTATHYASMMRDLWERGKTEIDAINGEVVRRGAMQGISCPVNSTLTRLIHAFEPSGGCSASPGAS